MSLYLVVEGPVVDARDTATVKVILITQALTALLARMRGVVVAVIVEDLVVAGHGADDGHHGHVAVAVAHHVGIARVIDETETGEGGRAHFVQMRLADRDAEAEARSRRRHAQLRDAVSVAGEVLQVLQEDGSDAMLLPRFTTSQTLPDGAQVNGHDGAPEEVGHAALTLVGDQLVDARVAARVVEAFRAAGTHRYVVVEHRLEVTVGHFAERAEGEQSVFAHVAGVQDIGETALAPVVGLLRFIAAHSTAKAHLFIPLV